MKPIWKILIAATVVAALLMALLAIPHYRAKAAVRTYRERLTAEGEKLTIAELTPSLSAEEVSTGRELLAGSSMLSTLTNPPPMMRWISPGHALVGWRETNSITDDSSNNWPDVKAVVEKRPEAAAKTREAVKLPFGVALDHQQGYSLLLPHLAQIKRTSIRLAGEAMLDLHEGNTSNAWDNLEAAIELTGNYRVEPIMISHMVRMTMMHLALGTTWEALQYPGWSEEQLAQLQRNWESFDMLAGVDICLSMERAVDPMEIARMGNTYSNFINSISVSADERYENFGKMLAAPMESMKAQVRYQVWKWQGCYQEEVFMAQRTQAALEALRHARTNEAFFPEFYNFNQAVTNLEKAHPRWERRFPFAVGEEFTLPNFLLKAADAETARRMTVAAIALERYRRRHGKYPEQLPELTPEFLAKAPIDFMDGKPLRYRRKDDGTFLLYSVGEDGKDDGGDGSVPPKDTSPTKMWYRMRNAVWPSPAAPDEVKKYEVEMLKKIKIKPPEKLPPRRPIPKPAGTNSKTN